MCLSCRRLLSRSLTQASMICGPSLIATSVKRIRITRANRASTENLSACAERNSQAPFNMPRLVTDYRVSREPDSYLSTSAVRETAASALQKSKRSFAVCHLTPMATIAPQIQTGANLLIVRVVARANDRPPSARKSAQKKGDYTDNETP